jgi:hypothetical protein
MLFMLQVSDIEVTVDAHSKHYGSVSMNTILVLPLGTLILYTMFRFGSFLWS